MKRCSAAEPPPSASGTVRVSSSPSSAMASEAQQLIAALAERQTTVGLPGVVDYLDHNTTSSSLFDKNLTYSFDKISCVRTFYFLHVTSCYVVFISGLAAMVVRALPPRFKRFHPLLGRIYIMAMLWATATSLLIHNTGLPLATLIGFAAVIIGMSVAWPIIVYHRSRMDALAAEAVSASMSKGDPPAPLAEMLGDAKRALVASKTWRERMLSLPALHGALFFMSWFNIMGRIFASDQSGSFTCHTFPVYKPLDTKEFAGAGNPLTVVPVANPNYDRLPWAMGQVPWAVITIGGSFVVALLFGASWSLVMVRRERHRVDIGDGEVEVEKKTDENASERLGVSV